MIVKKFVKKEVITDEDELELQAPATQQKLADEIGKSRTIVRACLLGEQGLLIASEQTFRLIRSRAIQLGACRIKRELIVD